VLITKPGHFQRIGNTAAGFLGQALYVRIGVVMSHEHCILRFQRCTNTGLKVGFFVVAQGLWLRLVCQMFLNENTVFNSRHYCISVLR